jgi:hypothetical protein
MEGYRQLISLDYIKQITRKIKKHIQLNKNSNHIIVFLSSSYDLSNLKPIGESLYKVIL